MGQTEFLQWVEENAEYVQEVGKLIAQPIHASDPESLKEQMMLLLTHRATLVAMLSLLNKFLTIARLEFLPEKSKEKSDMDRRAMLEKETAEHEYWVQLVNGFITTIDKQVSSSQTILSYEKKAWTQPMD